MTDFILRLILNYFVISPTSEISNSFYIVDDGGSEKGPFLPFNCLSIILVWMDTWGVVSSRKTCKCFKIHLKVNIYSFVHIFQSSGVTTESSCILQASNCHCLQTCGNIKTQSLLFNTYTSNQFLPSSFFFIFPVQFHQKNFNSVTTIKTKNKKTYSQENKGSWCGWCSWIVGQKLTMLSQSSSEQILRKITWHCLNNNL